MAQKEKVLRVYLVFCFMADFFHEEGECAP